MKPFERVAQAMVPYRAAETEERKVARSFAKYYLAWSFIVIAAALAALALDKFGGGLSAADTRFILTMAVFGAPGVIFTLSVLAYCDRILALLEKRDE